MKIGHAQSSHISFVSQGKGTRCFVMCVTGVPTNTTEVPLFLAQDNQQNVDGVEDVNGQHPTPAITNEECSKASSQC